MYKWLDQLEYLEYRYVLIQFPLCVLIGLGLTIKMVIVVNTWRFNKMLTLKLFDIHS